MILEIACIIFQATRGESSHFNVSTSLNSAIFSIMGFLILINTFILIALLVSIISSNEVELMLKLSFGAALGSVLIASFYGAKMGSLGRNQIQADVAGELIPFLGWNMKAKDLRIPHFVGLHGLQVIPLFAYSLRQTDFKYSVLVLVIFSILYYLLILFSIPLVTKILTWIK